MTWLFSAKQHYVHRELQDFLPQKTLFLHHLSSLQRALNKKSSAYKPSPRHLLSGDTKGSASAYTIWAYFGNNQRVSSSVFQRSPIIIVVGWGIDRCRSSCNTYFTIPKVIFKFCHFSSQMQLPRIFFLLQAMRYARMRANIYFRANKEIVTELILIKINSSLFVHKKLSKFLPRAAWCLDIVM